MRWFKVVPSAGSRLYLEPLVFTKSNLQQIAKAMWKVLQVPSSRVYKKWDDADSIFY